LKAPGRTALSSARSETSSVFIIRPIAQRYGGLVTTSWLLAAFDIAGEVSFAGMSTPTKPAFKLVLKENRAYLDLQEGRCDTT
jgi:hypothetical protein